MGLIYARRSMDPSIYQEYSKFLIHVYKNMLNINIFLNRVKEYKESGRIQNINEARLLDIDILEMLNTNSIPYHVFDATEDSINDIVDLIVRRR